MALAPTDAVITSATAPRAIVASAVANQPLPPTPSLLPQRVTAGLAGRTLTVSSNSQLILRPGEVILTFDDGPRPGKTERILETLEAFNVKATFLMLGSQAERHPALARIVAEQGHTIGTHTYDHVDLSTLSLTGAIAEIYAGQQAVAAALAPMNLSPSRFFRFPYLAQTGLIRTTAIDNNFIVLDVDVDSKDYYSESPQTVMQRTLARLDARGSGIILFHDIHARTATLLPEFLGELRARGYSVVTLRSSGGSVFDEPVITADVL
ncbi:polysaccharide deacetylase family protein [Pelagibacterium lacus]|uniref:Chitooligosaccharide deacetylase n=1 Tax=Pelagibacterium lacus TaxID=2282655 RepID=A0A369WE22_9HYPH|nr:polysaccharide deacetylase family protein [Pelagibacterium lacus]RDE10381.1 polysaccharide deacetylase family protein [Pelagibacterium lacus]